MAKLYFKYGAMNSGKTALLLQAAYNYEERGMKVYIIKPSCDTKGKKKIVSRIGLSREIDLLLQKEDSIYQEILKLKKHPSCIFVDEAQFLSTKQVEELMQIVVKLNIPVLCYGLRTDFQTNGFEGSKRLLEIAHCIEEMKTICNCGKKAIFNARKIGKKYVVDGEQIAIDDKENLSYEAMCAKCYYTKVKKNTNL